MYELIKIGNQIFDVKEIFDEKKKWRIGMKY